MAHASSAWRRPARAQASAPISGLTSLEDGVGGTVSAQFLLVRDAFTPRVEVLKERGADRRSMRTGRYDAFVVTISERERTPLFDGHVYCQGEENGIVEERHHPVQQGHAPHRGAENLHVGHLRRHPDHERVVEEIPRARLLGAWKAEPPGIGALVGRMAPIEEMGVMKRHDGVQRRPPEWHADHCEHETTGVWLSRLVQERED